MHHAPLNLQERVRFCLASGAGLRIKTVQTRQEKSASEKIERGKKTGLGFGGVVFLLQVCVCINKGNPEVKKQQRGLPFYLSRAIWCVVSALSLLLNNAVQPECGG